MKLFSKLWNTVKLPKPKKAGVFTISAATTSLRAPAAGTIFPAEVRICWNVLQPSQAIARVPEGKLHFVFQAQMPSQEERFLEGGMPV